MVPRVIIGPRIFEVTQSATVVGSLNLACQGLYNALRNVLIMLQS